MRAIAECGLAAVVGEAAPRRVTEATLWEYETALERLMARQPILPARFGSELPDRDAALTILRERRDELAASIDRVESAVELAVRAVWCDGERAPTGSGTSYMLWRLDQNRRAERLSSAMEPFAEMARAHRLRLQPSPGVAAVGAYLVERSRIEEFVWLARDVDRELDAVTVSCSGPWPPYTFAQGAAP